MESYAFRGFFVTIALVWAGYLLSLAGLDVAALFFLGMGFGSLVMQLVSLVKDFAE